MREIDLSALTAEEREQFSGENAVVLKQGDFDAALYLRYSSDRQTEQSIEGQLRDEIAYCKRNNYRVRAVYVDRATTARKDSTKRYDFQRMIEDSAKKTWNIVLVWKLDRFARNKQDSVIYKMRLRKNGVRVVSATELISDNPEGNLMESVLEGIAEYYSAELSQKITRGRRETALKLRNLGGIVPLGYKIEDHKLVVDPITAKIVHEAFELYADGWALRDIADEFNRRGYKSARGAAFNGNSFCVMFRSKKYLGVYRYKDMEIPNGMPAIIEPELFEKVNNRLLSNAHAPARNKAKVDYLLSGKIFCGHCGTRPTERLHRGLQRI